jgi:hypothetical protein
MTKIKYTKYELSLIREYNKMLEKRTKKTLTRKQRRHLLEQAKKYTTI